MEKEEKITVGKLSFTVKMDTAQTRSNNNINTIKNKNSNGDLVVSQQIPKIKKREKKDLLLKVRSESHLGKYHNTDVTEEDVTIKKLHSGKHRKKKIKRVREKPSSNQSLSSEPTLLINAENISSKALKILGEKSPQREELKSTSTSAVEMNTTLKKTGNNKLIDKLGLVGETQLKIAVQDSSEMKSRQKLMKFMGLDENSVISAQNEAAASIIEGSNSKKKKRDKKGKKNSPVKDIRRSGDKLEDGKDNAEMESLSAFSTMNDNNISTLGTININSEEEEHYTDKMNSIINSCFKKQLKNIIKCAQNQSDDFFYENKSAISAPMGIGLLHMDYDRWWDNTSFFGDVFISGHYYADHPESTIDYLKFLNSTSLSKNFHRLALKYIQNVTGTSNILALEEFAPIQLSDRVITQISCGYNSVALVSDLGEIYIQTSKNYFSISIGLIKPPDDWRGNFTVDKLLGRRVKKVACGPYHFAAITDTKEIITWGLNASIGTGKMTGQLGHKIDKLSSPAIITGFLGVPTQVACGSNHTIILTTKGVFSFGSNNFGQLGSETIADIVYVRGIQDSFSCDCVVSRVSCGTDHTLVATEDGLLFSWGANHYGQLGVANRVNFITKATRIDAIPNVINVACGAYHSMVMNDKGEVFTFGSNFFGELGINNQSIRFQYTPTIVNLGINNLSTVTSISSGPFTSIAITDSGIVYIWGMLVGENCTRHQYAPRCLTQFVHKNLFISSMQCGLTNFAFIADRALSNAIIALIPACQQETSFAGGPLVKTLLNIPSPERMVTILQNRVLQHIHKESNYLKPYATVETNYIEFSCVGSRITVSREILVKNQSDTRVIVKFSSVDKANPKQVICFQPSVIKLKRRGTAKVRVMLISSKLLSEPISKLINVVTSRDEKQSSSSNFTRSFIIANISPTRSEKKIGYVEEEKTDHLKLVKSLGTYVPRVLLEGFANNPTPPERPSISHFPAVILFLDISGFTSLNERLAQLGPAGPELVSKHINSYFASLIKAVDEHGGDVLKFAGDALICMFGARNSDQSLELLTLRAVQCAFEIQTKLDKYDSNEGFSLTLHIGIGSGDLVSLCVGGIDGSWEFLVSGDPLVQLRTAVDNSKTGEVVVSSQSWELIQSYCDGEPRGNDYYVKSIKSPIPVQRLKTIPGWPREDGEAALRCFIPLAVQSSLDSQQLPGWGDELRVATILFVKLNSHIDDSDKGQFLTVINDILGCMQQVIFKYEGMVRQFLSDDKGTVLIAAFGLPPFSHEDDAIRGVKTAVEIHRDLLRLNMQSSIGVTTGQVFCGSVGCPMRQEYAMVGDIVNLSARLMVAADKLNAQVLCDQPTFDAAHSALEFEALTPIFVKGKQNSIAIYKPCADSMVSRLIVSDRIIDPMPSIFGRRDELNIIERSCAELEFNHPKVQQTIVIDGQQGSGKSLITNHLMIFAKQFQIKICHGISDSVQKTTPLYPFRTLIADMLEITDIYHAKEIEMIEPDVVLSQLQKYMDKNWLDYAPLLNQLLPIELPENEITNSIIGRKNRTNQLANFLKRLIMNFSLKNKFILILEDINQMDSISLDLIVKIVLEVPALLVLTVRPITQPDQGFDLKLNEITSFHTTLQVHLNNLSAQSTNEMVCHLLNVESLSSSMKQLFSKVNGNPRLIEEMAMGLKESSMGSLVIDPQTNECSVIGNIDEIALTALKSTHQSRLDRLGSDHQMVLKVASVIGFKFDIITLTAIFPIAGSEKKYILRQLEALAKLNIISKVGQFFSFRSQILLEVAFSRLTFAQRSKLHLSIADLYEKKPSTIANENTRIKLIAYHLAQVIDIAKDSPPDLIVKTITQLRLAGEAAARIADTEEAFTWWNYAMNILKDLPDGPIKREINKELQLKIVGIGLNVPVVSIKSILEQAMLLDDNYMPPQNNDKQENFNPLTLRNLTKFYQE